METDVSAFRRRWGASVRRLGRAADGVAQSLEERGWACLDGFCGTDLVQRVLREIGGLEPFYDPSEIWVGSSSTVGAQVVVPSVRGDKVLWMCGAHPQAQGDANSRAIREKGGVDAALHIRRVRMRLACLEIWALLAFPLAVVFALDPETQQLSLTYGTGKGGGKHSGICSGGRGRLYCAPSNGFRVRNTR